MVGKAGKYNQDRIDKVSLRILFAWFSCTLSLVVKLVVLSMPVKPALSLFPANSLPLLPFSSLKSLSKSNRVSGKLHTTRNVDRDKHTEPNFRYSRHRFTSSTLSVERNRNTLNRLYTIMAIGTISDITIFTIKQELISRISNLFEKEVLSTLFWTIISGRTLATDQIHANIVFNFRFSSDFLL